MDEIQQVPNINVIFDTVPGPDGSLWARLTIANGATASVLALPAHLMEQLMSGVNGEWSKLKAHIERETSPLKKYNPADLARIGKTR